MGILLALWIVLMPAPTNISFATATDIGTTLPYTTTQVVDFGGTTYTVWYKYTAQTGDTEISVFPFGDLVTYTPDVTFWTDASTQYLFNNAQNRPSQIPVTPGTTYAFKISPNGGNPSPANLTLTVKLGPDDQLTAGQIAINDSTNGYPAVIMSPTTAEPVKFVPGFAAGEGTAVLSSGIVAAIDEVGDRVKIYNQALTLIATPTMPATGYTQCLACNQIETFWVGKHGGGAVHGSLVSFDSTGTFGTPLDTGAVGCDSIAPFADGSAILFARSLSTANTAVLKITNPAAVVTTFLAGVAGYNFGGNLFMLTDDTVLVPYEQTGFATVIKRYNSSAVLQNTYMLAVDAGLQRIFGDPADPAYFWIWTQTATTSTFTKIKVSDGSTTVVGPWPLFIEGDYQPNASATPTAYFGADFSCVPWIIRGTTTTTTYPIRRQRRFLLPSSDDNHVMQIPVIELLMRTGIGLTAGPPDTPVQGEDPQVMIRLSKDGGKTWGNERWVSAGALGEYRDRVRLLRATGNYRNAVLEVTVSDPVDVQFLAALAPNGIVEGSS